MEFVFVTETGMQVLWDHRWSGPCLVFNSQLQEDCYADIALRNCFNTGSLCFSDCPGVPPGHTQEPTQHNPAGGAGSQHTVLCC